MHEHFMRRCFTLAQKAGKEVRPNPRVGAVLVHNKKIIGEGYHKQAGKEHAEVNCIQNVSKIDRPLITESTLYISLEPCSIYGRTPACTDLILREGIQKVVISTLDPNPLVNGNGIRILQGKGVQVIHGILENEGKKLIKNFRINQMGKRPYVILKIVKSKNNKIGQKGKKIWLSNQATTKLSHKWRSEIDGIVIGSNTAINDDPSLTNRHFGQNQPTRITFDRENKIPIASNIKDGQIPTLIFTGKDAPENQKNLEYIPFEFENEQFILNVLDELFQRGIYNLMIEGGAKLIRSFLASGLWDEARVVSCPIILDEGINAPNVTGKLIEKKDIGGDELQIIMNKALH